MPTQWLSTVNTCDYVLKGFHSVLQPIQPMCEAAGRARDLIAPCVERLAKLFHDIATSATTLCGQVAYRDLGLPLAPPVSAGPR